MPENITKHERYSEDNKERLQKWLELDTDNYLMSDKVRKRNWYWNISEEDKQKLKEHGQHYRKCRYQNMSGEGRQKIKEYMKKHRKNRSKK